MSSERNGTQHTALDTLGFRAILDNLREAVYVRDRDRRLLYINPAAERLSGWALDEALEMPCYDVFGDANRRCNRLCPVDKSLLEERPLHHLEGSIASRDGSKVRVGVSISPLKDDAGDLVGSIVILDPIHEKDLESEGHLKAAMRLKRSQAALAEKTRFLQGVLDAISQGVCVFDKSGHLAAWNSRFVEILDLPERWPRLGRTYESFVRLNAERGEYGDDDAEAIVARRLEDFARPGGVKARTYERARPDGTIVHVEHSEMPGGGLVATYTDVTEARRAEERIRQLALQDGLTGLANRTQFNTRLDDAINNANRSGGLVGLALLDLDRFKSVNDTFGHGVGDKLLKQVSERLSGLMRKTDTVARLGGDEFAIILTHVKEPSHAIRPARRIIRALGAPFDIDGRIINTGTSIGITFFPADAKTPQELIRKADLALYEAKAAGRGTFRLFDDALDQRVQAQRRVEDDMRRALRRNEFELHYQPIMALPDHAVVGVEALIRWRHPEQGLLSPAAFIPVAEMCGLIVPIGNWVLRQACRQSRAWLDAGLAPLRVAVNVSAPQFQGDALLATVRAALDDAKIPPHRLEIEINESLTMGDTDHAIAQLRKLADLGVTLAIDDFGTGYSSLAYLKRFPVHRLKIDQSFVHGMATDPADAAITETVVRLGQSLALKVVAEGVESADHVSLLTALGCDEVQGFHFGKPMTNDDLMPWLRARAAA